ncbi:hypothetical protein D3C80_2047030 [compost metagenome]
MLSKATCIPVLKSISFEASIATEATTAFVSAVSMASSLVHDVIVNRAITADENKSLIFFIWLGLN